MRALLPTFAFLLIAASAGAADIPARGELRATKIVVADLDASVDFYTRIVGLKRLDGGKISTRDIPLNTSGRADAYHLVLAARKGAIPDRSQAGRIVIGVKVADIRIVTERARAVGSAVIEEPEASRGREAQFLDPSGYVVEVLQDTPPTGGASSPSYPDGLISIRIEVADLERTKAFYTGIIGMKGISLGPPGRVVHEAYNPQGVRTDPHITALQNKEVPIRPGEAARVIVAAQITDVADALKRARAAGFKARKTLDGASIADPDGYLVELTQGK